MSNRNTHTTPAEQNLLLPAPPSPLAIVDTHTHLALTFTTYRKRYRQGKYRDIHEFVRNFYDGRNVEAIVDVWCEAPVQKKVWKELANSALNVEDRKRIWGGVNYWFVMGVHPHQAKFYTDKVEKDIVEAMAHPRCVGWGEMGLDYYYDTSPRNVQRVVFIRQLRKAVSLGKPLTIHSREADADTERILKKEVPADHRIHIHCFTNAPEFAQRLLEHFPNLYIGITGVVTFSSNQNTSAVLKKMVATNPGTLRILLETDAPYMVPSNVYKSLTAVEGKLPLSHSAMIPWIAHFVANTAGAGWTADKVMVEARENARIMYGV